jgi:hypothetical protein
MDKYCKMHTIKYIKKPGTKTVWLETGKVTEDIDEGCYRHVVDASPCFRRAGCSETVTRGFTYRGYLPIEIVSTSPDKQNRTRRIFEF